MLRTYRRPFLVLLLALLPLSALAGGKCFMWKAQRGRATVYLAGSLHMARQNMYPLDQTLEKAFDSSDHLVLEVNASSPETQMAAAMMMMQKGMYQPGESLQTKISKATYNKLQAYANKKGMNVAQFDRMRPWLVGLTLAKAEVQNIGMSEEIGIEKHFIERAISTSKPIIELETVIEQVNLLAAGTDTEQELALSEGIDQLPKTRNYLDRMVNAWINGNVQAMEQLMKENLPKHPKLQAQNKRLFDDRNVRMANTVQGYFNTDKTYFVLVGSGHLVGPNGIVKLLHNKGFAFQQCNKTSR